MRLLLYSHDSFGLGHLRRSVSIASRLLEVCPDASILIATGSPVATGFRLPHGIDILKLPSVTKDEHGGYVSREWTMGLQEIIGFRSNLLASAVRGFRPHALLVDHKPLGLLGELESAFEEARRIGTRCVLGIRDIVDHPSAMAAEWGTSDVQRVLKDVYARILVYGDRSVFDASVEYSELSSVVDRLEFTGYVVRTPTRPICRPLALLHPHVVLTVGGGEDGADRVGAYLDAVQGSDCPWTSTIVLGPLFDGDASRRVRRRAGTINGLTVHRSHDDLPALFRDASAVVSMAGYNTCAEILQARVPSVLMPRSEPRREQLVRAERLAGLGLAEIVQSPTPNELREHVARAIRRRRVRDRLPSLDGARHAASFLVRCAVEGSRDVGCRSGHPDGERAVRAEMAS